MKKIIIQTLIQTLLFIIVYNVMSYFFGQSKLSFFEHVKYKLSVNYIFIIIMSFAFFLGNYFSKNGELSWRDLFNKLKNNI